MSAAFLNETTGTNRSALRKSPCVATAAEAIKNYLQNKARTWYRDSVEADDRDGKYAFQRLRDTWFTPPVEPKFKLYRDDKFYAIGSCFARGLENSLAAHKIAVESAAPEFAKLQPANRERSALDFTNKYNTYSILNELRRALDPAAEFPRESIVQLTDTTWYDPHHPHFKLRWLGRDSAASRPDTMNTFSTMDIVVANTWAKSLLRAVAHEWAGAHANVDYFPNYEIVQNSDRAAVWEPDLRHVKGAGAQHIMELFAQNYLE